VGDCAGGRRDVPGVGWVVHGRARLVVDEDEVFLGVFGEAVELDDLVEALVALVRGVELPVLDEERRDGCQ
jgi:hypothetical protein